MDQKNSKPKFREFTGTMYPVYSSQIANIGHQMDKERNEGFMQVEFSRGDLYQYFPVSKELFSTFFDAKSKGKWFTDNIRKNTAIQFEKKGAPKLDV